MTLELIVSSCLGAFAQDIPSAWLLLLLFLKYVFIYLAVSDLSCIMQDLLLRCVDSLVVAQRLQSGRLSSYVHGLSCYDACGILVP